MKKTLTNNKLIIFFTLISTLFFFCKTSFCQSENISFIKLKSDLGPVPAKMSDFFSKISYMPLETNPNCLIGYMNIPVFGKYIIIRSSGDIGDEKLFLFSSEGKFLNQIGNSGRGPGEYQNGTDVLFVDDTVFVVSNYTNEIICYSLNGEFKKKYHVNTKSRLKSIAKLTDSSFVISLSSSDKLGNILKSDRNFNIKTGFKINVPLDYTAVPLKFQRSGKKIFYYNNYIDTIFEMSMGHPVPTIVIEYGKYRLSRNRASLNEKENTILNSPRIIDFNASAEYMLLNIWYPFMNNIYTVLYRISDNKQVTWGKLINDIDKGTIDRWPGFLSGNNLIFTLMASTVLERFGKMTDSEKSDPKNSGFVEMASKLKPNSNPILMICNLK